MSANEVAQGFKLTRFSPLAAALEPVEGSSVKRQITLVTLGCAPAMGLTDSGVESEIGPPDLYRRALHHRVDHLVRIMGCWDHEST